MNGRVYDYALGRFTGVDPLIQFPLNSQSLNPYSYILNNPLSGTDPTGYACEAATGTHIKSCETITATEVNTDGSKGESRSTRENAGTLNAYISSLSNGADLGQTVKGAITSAKETASQIGSAGKRLIESAAPQNSKFFGMADEERSDQPIDAWWVFIGAFNGLAQATNDGYSAYFSYISGGRISDFRAFSTFPVPEGQTRSAAIGEGVSIAATLPIVELRGAQGAARAGARATTDIVATRNGLVNVRSTLDRIKAGEKFPHRNDGSVFQNREGLLPKQADGYYREFVHPTPGVNGPGAQRIIQGQNGELYYSPDHYGTFIPLN